jgi:diadenosine tetraphosphate (Ap4A) HIT family hydrolase
VNGPESMSHASDPCPFDRPRVEPNDYWETVIEMGVSTLCLLKRQATRGHCILIYDPAHVTRPDQLTEDEWALFSRDAHGAVAALMEVFAADHANLECLGNEMPHLHWHVLPRYRSDPRWGGPVWTTTREELPRYEMGRAERTRRIRELRAALAARGFIGRGP